MESVRRLETDLEKRLERVTEKVLQLEKAMAWEPVGGRERYRLAWGRMP
jgi:hypothetical protein